MSASSLVVTATSVDDMLRHMHSKGIALWAVNGQLRYRAPKGSMTPQDVHALLACRSEIIGKLEAKRQPTVEPAVDHQRHALTFSQLTHWHGSELQMQSSVRHIVSASRLRGRLNIKLLERSLAQLVHRHEALRSRIVLHEGAPMLEVAPSGTLPCTLHDLTNHDPRQREHELEQWIRGLVLEPLTVVEGTLTIVHLARLDRHEHALVIAMEHIISDVVSMNILTRELFAMYRQLELGDPVQLPAVITPFSEYARWQRAGHEKWLDEHGGYWNRRLQDCGRLSFPRDVEGALAGRAGWGTVAVQVGPELKTALHAWCRKHRTTLVLAMLTAFATAVLRWCNSADGVIRYQTNGRSEPSIANTIGYFASMLHLRVQMPASGDFLALLKQLTDEYCNAYQHHDFSYIDAQVPAAEYTRNPCFNWIAGDAAGREDDASASTGLRVEPVRFANPRLDGYDKDAEPVLLLYEGHSEILGGVHFPRDRLSAAGMQRFVATFMEVLEGLKAQADAVS